MLSAKTVSYCQVETPKNPDVNTANENIFLSWGNLTDQVSWLVFKLTKFISPHIRVVEVAKILTKYVQKMSKRLNLLLEII